MLASSGAKFFGQWWCDAVGAVNVAQELTTDNSVEVNMEQVYAWNPDTIVVTNFTAAQPEDLMNNTIGNYDWNTVAAIQNGRVFKMPLGMYRKMCIRDRAWAVPGAASWRRWTSWPKRGHMRFTSPTLSFTTSWATWCAAAFPCPCAGAMPTRCLW